MKSFFRKPFFRSTNTILVIWIVLAIIATFTKGGFDMHLNNFRIYRMVFYHTIEMQDLYAFYPEQYYDHNLYGPIFSIIIAPFAILPPVIGLLCWELFMSIILFLAIRNLPLRHLPIIFIMWFVTNEVLGALQMAQFNIIITALIISTYSAIRAGKNWAAALFIMIGTMTKIYGIVAIALVVFSRKKFSLFGWMSVWAAVLFILPMLISSPSFIIGQYSQWISTLFAKNNLNAEAVYQNISTLGMIHRITGTNFNDLYILIPAFLLFMLPSIRLNQYKSYGFQWALVASLLMCVILFSTGSESSGYIIALTGVAIWYITAPWQRSKVDMFLLILVLVISSFGHSDLMPRAIRKGFILPYALKALPITLVWLKLIWEMCVKNYAVTGMLNHSRKYTRFTREETEVSTS